MQQDTLMVVHGEVIEQFASPGFSLGVGAWWSLHRGERNIWTPPPLPVDPSGIVNGWIGESGH